MRDQPDGVAALTALELKKRLNEAEPLLLLDVREDDERAYCAIATAELATDLHVPMGQVTAGLDSIAQAAADQPIVVYCHLGQRSMIVARWLVAQGLERVHNLEGGIDAWSTQVDPRVPRY